MITHEEIDALDERHEASATKKEMMHRRLEREECPALIWHGPGHQSSTFCDNGGDHDVHYTAYGSMRQYAEWRGIVATSGFFDEPPELEDV